MAAGWSAWGKPQYPQCGPDKRSYGPKLDRTYRIAWLQGNRDREHERRLLQWISNTTGEYIDEDRDLGECLQDGVLLCRLMQSLAPGSITRINNKSSSFGASDNIAHFNAAARRYGLRADEIFELSDLNDLRNVSRVVHTLDILMQLVVLFVIE